MDSVLFNIFIFLTAACVVVPLASLFKLGSVLGYLTAGIVIGPFGLGLIGDAEKVMHFAEFGVMMRLFLIGLELDPALLWRLRKSILGLGSLQVILTSMAFMLIGLALGYSWQMSLTAGMALPLAAVVGITLLMQLVGVSPAMGTFIAGAVLANSEYRHTLQTDIEPFKGLLLGLFFISVGMGMDFQLFAEAPL
ncbi:MAG: cation:proton antiporter [Methylobacter sp.]|nr:cation:proton antiporter [Methylobacter sp.]